MNFCVANLILNMEENMQLFSILLCFIISRKAKSKTDLCSVWRRCCYWLNLLVKSGFRSFVLGDFSLDNAPQSGRPVEIDCDQIHTLTENNQPSLVAHGSTM